MQTWMRRTSGSRNGRCRKHPAMSNGRKTRTLSHKGVAQVISKRDHAHAAAIAAERGDDAHPIRAWDDARRASEDEDDVREVAFEFPVENFVEEQLNEELVEEEGEAPAAGAVAPTGSAVKATHTEMLSIWAKNIVSFADALVEAARPCHQAVTNGTFALITLDTEVPGQPSVTALHWLHVDDVTCRNDGRVTGLVGRQQVPIEVRAPRHQARLRRQPCLWGLPNLASMCWGEHGADKRGTKVWNVIVELGNTCLARQQAGRRHDAGCI